MELDIEQALQFLDILEAGGRHTIASEAPFGGVDNGPIWEAGRTFEARQRELLIADIKKRQARKSNVYYSVNKPCKITERQGSGGKNNIDDIIAIRAMAFDIDFTSFSRDQQAVLNFIDNLTDITKPSLVINTGGGFHLLYLLDPRHRTRLFRPAKTDEEKQMNELMIKDRTVVTTLGHDFETLLRSKFASLPVKVDNMSNIDRVMRLPGTVNYPKAEKLAKGQQVALAHIARNYCCKHNIRELRSKVPNITPIRANVQRQPFIPRKDSKWTAYKKALACVEFIRDQGLADTNEWYTLHVMLPLIGAIHDDNEANTLTIDEATELFLEAVSGGARYGVMGRGQGYFMRQWKSHRPELPRNGTKSLGGLIWAAKENGFKPPWIGEVMWEEDYLKMKEDLERQKKSISQDDKDLFGSG
jgi:hypothetical protein